MHGATGNCTWHRGDPHSDTSNSVYTTVKLPTLCIQKCYQESADRCMYCILFIIFYVHVLKLQRCMTNNLHHATSHRQTDVHSSGFIPVQCHDLHWTDNKQVSDQ